jgi:hypothetical protein
MALIAAPLIVLVALLLHPVEKTTATAQVPVIAAHPQRWYAAHLLLLAGCLVLVPAILELARLLRGRADRAAAAGAVLGVAGAFGLFGVVTIEGLGSSRLVGAGLSPVDEITAVHAVVASAAVVVPLTLLGVCLCAGLVILGVGARRAGVVPVRDAVLVAASGVLLLAGFAGAQNVTRIGAAVLLVGMADIGARQLGAGSGAERSGAPVLTGFSS